MIALEVGGGDGARNRKRAARSGGRRRRFEGGGEVERPSRGAPKGKEEKLGLLGHDSAKAA